MSEKCCAKVYNSLAWKSFHCGARAKVERDGKHYCGRHDPVKIAEKRAAKHAAWVANWAANEKRDAHECACLAAIASIGGDPATVGELVRVMRRLAARFESNNRVPVERAIIYSDSGIAQDMRAVLAKLPQENSND